MSSSILKVSAYLFFSSMANIYSCTTQRARVQVALESAPCTPASVSHSRMNATRTSPVRSSGILNDAPPIGSDRNQAATLNRNNQGVSQRAGATDTE